MKLSAGCGGIAIALGLSLCPFHVNGMQIGESPSISQGYLNSQQVSGELSFLTEVSESWEGRDIVGAAKTVSVPPDLPGLPGSSLPVIDGDFSDWVYRSPFIDSMTDGVSVNWEKVWITSNSEYFFFSYTNTEIIDQGALHLRSLYLDYDKNSATGYNFDLLGGDYLLQGKSLYQYTGTGLNWSWSYIQDVEYAVTGNQAEFSIPRSQLGLSTDPNSYRALFYGYDLDGSNLDYILIDMGAGEGSVVTEDITIPPP
jgi:hypothetical protein